MDQQSLFNKQVRSTNNLKTKLHLDNVNGVTKDKITKDTSDYCDIFNARYINKNKHNESDGQKENDNQKKNLLMKSGEIKLMS